MPDRDKDIIREDSYPVEKFRRKILIRRKGGNHISGTKNVRFLTFL